MVKAMKRIALSEIKDDLSKYLRLAESEEIVITKHGRPVAQLAPISTDTHSLFGYMKDTMKIEGDVMASVEEKWSALSGDEDHLYTRRSKKPSRKK